MESDKLKHGNTHSAIPFEHQVWSTTEIAEFLRKSPSHVRERIVSQPDFPVARRLPTKKGAGNRLWKAIEVIKWLEKYKEGEFEIQSE